MAERLDRAGALLPSSSRPPAGFCGDRLVERAASPASSCPAAEPPSDRARNLRRRVPAAEPARTAARGRRRPSPPCSGYFAGEPVDFSAVPPRPRPRRSPSSPASTPPPAASPRARPPPTARSPATSAPAPRPPATSARPWRSNPVALHHPLPPRARRRRQARRLLRPRRRPPPSVAALLDARRASRLGALRRRLQHAFGSALRRADARPAETLEMP